MSFASLGLSAPILEAVAAQGYETPSPIQLKAIPSVVEGRDVMAAAQTGTGKTAGFTLPLLERLSKGPKAKATQVRALVLTPTRELAAQVAESVSTYGQKLPLKSAVVFGGVKINPQINKLRGGCDVLVATPGRLIDLYNQKAVRFDQLEILVLDEADRMLDMGFIHDIRKILAILPKQRQNLLFSATFSNEIRELAKGLVNDPVEISVTPRNTTAKTVEQMVHPVDKKRKPALLTQLIEDEKWQQVLVFTKTKHGANRLTRHLEGAGIKAAAIHGNKSQGARTKALADFKSGAIRTLVATDIAARGLDIDQLPQVVNFELPNVAEDYVHRIGRTGRAGASGRAVSLVCADEFKLLAGIERLTNQLLDRQTISGFEPIEALPQSKLGQRIPKGNGGQRKKAKPAAGNGTAAANNGDKPAKPRRRRSSANAQGKPQANGEARSQNRSGNNNGNSNGNRAAKPAAKGGNANRSNNSGQPKRGTPSQRVGQPRRPATQAS